MAKTTGPSKPKSAAKSKAKAKSKTKPKPKAAAKSKAKPKPKTAAKATPKRPAKKKAAAKPKAAARKKAVSARGGESRGVPAAVAATLANAQEQLAALNEVPAVSPGAVDDAAPPTAQDTAVAATPVSRALPAPAPAFERMPTNFWPAINVLCDRPEAVREAYRHGHSGPGSPGVLLGVIIGAAGAYGGAMGATNTIQGAAGLAGMIPLTAIKLPVLLLAAYAFAFAPLYLAARFLGYPYTLAQAAKLLLASTAVTAVTLAGMIPIAVLFSATAAGYSAMQGLHAVMLIVSVLMAALFFTTRTHAIHGRHATIRPLTLMAIYLLFYGLVALQWFSVTGPYIGDPEAPFALLRIGGR